MEAVALHAVLLRPLGRGGVESSSRGIGAVEARLEGRHQRRVAEDFAEHPHRRDVRRVVHGHHGDEILHPLQQLLIHQRHRLAIAGHDRLEAHRAQFIRCGQRPAGDQSLQHERDALAVIGEVLAEGDFLAVADLKLQLTADAADPVGPAASQLALHAAAHLVQAELEARRADVRYQYLHRRFSSVEPVATRQISRSQGAAACGSCAMRLGRGRRGAIRQTRLRAPRGAPG